LKINEEPSTPLYGEGRLRGRSFCHVRKREESKLGETLASYREKTAQEGKVEIEQSIQNSIRYN
jgi:hypothetical protein